MNLIAGQISVLVLKLKIAHKRINPLIKKFAPIHGIIIALLINGYCTQSYAQVKLTDIEYATQYVPSSKYSMPIDETQRIKTNSSTVQNRHNVVLNFSLSTKIDTISKGLKLWSATMHGDYLLMKSTDYSQEIFPPSLFASNISVLHYRSLKNRWAFVASVSAGINSDLEEIDGNDIFANVGGLFIKSYNPKFSLGFGLFINNNFGKPLPWPALTVNWQLGDKYKLDINVPDRAPGLAYNISFTYLFNEQVDLAVYFKPSVISYDVENALENKRLLNNWKIPIGLKNQWNINHFVLSVDGGLMALRSFDYAEKDLAKMFAKNPVHMLGANWFLSIGAKYKL